VLGDAAGPPRGIISRGEGSSGGGVSLDEPPHAGSASETINAPTAVRKNRENVIINVERVASRNRRGARSP